MGRVDLIVPVTMASTVSIYYGCCGLVYRALLRREPEHCKPEHNEDIRCHGRCDRCLGRKLARERR